ncbi:MAG: DNRLRE domain-containing protein, partial [Caldilineae bacterium]
MRVSQWHRLLALMFLVLGFMMAFAAGGRNALRAATVQMSGDAAAPQPGTYPLGDGRYLAVIPAGAWPADTYNELPYIDTHVDSTAPESSFCQNTTMAVEYNSSEFGTVRKRAFLAFHLDTIPANAIIDKATFYAYLSSAGGDSSVPIAVRKITAYWNCPLKWNNMPPSSYYQSQTIPLKLGWKSWDITGLVDEWKGKKFQTAPNYGFELRGPEAGGATFYHWRYFNTRNAS